LYFCTLNSTSRQKQNFCTYKTASKPVAENFSLLNVKNCFIRTKIVSYQFAFKTWEVRFLSSNSVFPCSPYRIQIRRSAKIKRSGFLHTPNSGKTDGIVSNQWRIGIKNILRFLKAVWYQVPDTPDSAICAMVFFRLSVQSLVSTPKFF